MQPKNKMGCIFIYIRHKEASFFLHLQNNDENKFKTSSNVEALTDNATI